MCKLSGVMPPPGIMDALGLAAALVAPVVLLALGLKFTPKIQRPKLLAAPLVLRFALGGLIGLVFVKLFGLEGLNAEIAVLAGLAPIGFNSNTFSELEKLDVEFAASQVSISLIVALLAAPFVLRAVSYV